MPGDKVGTVACLTLHVVLAEASNADGTAGCRSRGKPLGTELFEGLQYKQEVISVGSKPYCGHDQSLVQRDMQKLQLFV